MKTESHNLELTHNKNRRIAKNTAILYVRMLFVLLISLYTTRVTLHVLGIEDFGVYNVVAGFVSLFAVMNTAMSNIIQRAYNYESTKTQFTHIRVYTTAIQVQAVIAVVVLVALETVGLWYVNNILVVPESRLAAVNIIFQCSSISLLFVIMQIPFSSLIMARERFDYYAIVSIIDVVLKLVVVIVLPFIPSDKLIIYGVFSLSISIMNFALYFSYCKISIKGNRFQLLFDKDQFVSLFSLSGWTMFDVFAFMLKGQGINMLINGFFGPAINAARGIAFQIMNAINGFSHNICTAFKPQLVQSYAQDDFGRTRELLFSMSKYAFVLLAALSIPLILNLDYVLSLWLKDDIPAYTQSFTILVLIDMVLSSLNTPLTLVALATGKIRQFQIVRSIITTLILPLSWLTLYLGADPSAVFVVCVVVTVINQPISLYLLKKVFFFKYDDYVRLVVKPCFLFVALTPILPLFAASLIHNSLIRLFVTGLLSVVLSLVVGFFAVLSKSEKAFVVKKLRMVR